MRSVVLFLEDLGHEILVKAFLDRLARESGAAITMTTGNASGGHGKAITELHRYLRDLAKGGRAGLPDLVVVAIDANCRGYSDRRKEIEAAVPEAYRDRIACAIPDPHVERWMLLDSGAFKNAFGKGCNAPDQKCDRDRYKDLLLNAIRESGVTPTLGGLEFAEDVVEHMDLARVQKADPSLNAFLDETRRFFRRWRSTETQ